MFRNRPSLRVEALESRALLAASAVLDGTTLVVTGTGGEETILVSPTATPGEVAVTINAVPFGTFTPAAVSVDAKGGSDYVIFEVAGLPATVSGGSGNDRITGPTVDGQVWNITGSNAGTVGDIQFSQFERIKGGGAQDIFAFQPGGKISGRVEGNDSFDVLDYSALPGPIAVNDIKKTASYIGGTYFGIEYLVGSASTNDKVTSNGGYFIHGEDDGAFRKTNVGEGGYISYSGIENLASTTAVEFKFFDGGVSGKVTAGAGSFLNYRFIGGGVVVDLNAGTATRIGGGISGIKDVWGTTGADVLIGDGKNNHFWGDDGNDLLDGRSGKDTLEGGSHMDVVLGGSGDDSLDGGTGEDVVIGGSGKDVLLGNDGNDILIGGKVPAFDPTEEDDAYANLWLISQEWTRTDVTYHDRIEHLLEGGGLNGDNVLDDDTVDDDGSADVLTGGLGNDWFIIGESKDTVTDPDVPSPEVVTEV